MLGEIANPPNSFVTSRMIGGFWFLDALGGLHTFTDSETPFVVKAIYGAALTCSTVEAGLYFLGLAGKIGYSLMKLGVRMGPVSASLFAFSQTMDTFMDEDTNGWERGASTLRFLGSSFVTTGSFSKSPLALGCLTALGVILTIATSMAEEKFREDRLVDDFIKEAKKGSTGMNLEKIKKWVEESDDDTIRKLMDQLMEEERTDLLKQFPKEVIRSFIDKMDDIWVSSEDYQKLHYLSFEVLGDPGLTGK